MVIVLILIHASSEASASFPAEKPWPALRAERESLPTSVFQPRLAGEDGVSSTKLREGRRCVQQPEAESSPGASPGGRRTPTSDTCLWPTYPLLTAQVCDTLRSAHRDGTRVHLSPRLTSCSWRFVVSGALLTLQGLSSGDSPTPETKTQLQPCCHRHTEQPRAHTPRPSCVRLSRPRVLITGPRARQLGQPDAPEPLRSFRRAVRSPLPASPAPS